VSTLDERLAAFRFVACDLRHSCTCHCPIPWHRKPSRLRRRTPFGWTRVKNPPRPRRQPSR